MQLFHRSSPSVVNISTSTDVARLFPLNMMQARRRARARVADRRFFWSRRQTGQTRWCPPPTACWPQRHAIRAAYPGCSWGGASPPSGVLADIRPAAQLPASFPPAAAQGCWLWFHLGQEGPRGGCADLRSRSLPLPERTACMPTQQPALGALSCVLRGAVAPARSPYLFCTPLAGDKRSRYQLRDRREGHPV